MNYTELRGLFKTINKGTEPPRRLMHNTYALLYKTFEDGGREGAKERIELRLGRTGINGVVFLVLDSLGGAHWATLGNAPSAALKQRLGRYLPYGGHVHSWGIRKGIRVWFYYSGGKSRPWKNESSWNFNSHRKDLCPELNNISATDIMHPLRALAAQSINRLVQGEIEENIEDCTNCNSFWIARHISDEDLYKDRQAHVLRHIQEGKISTGLLTLAAVNAKSAFVRRALHLAWKENQILWRKPKSQKGLIAQVERCLQEGSTPLDASCNNLPYQYKGRLRDALEDYLLHCLGFDIFENGLLRKG